MLMYVSKQNFQKARTCRAAFADERKDVMVAGGFDILVRFL